MKKIFLFILLFSLSIVCFSCKNGEIDNNETTNEIQTDAFIDKLKEYTIVRSDISSESITAAAVNIRLKIEEITGVKIELTTDWTKKGDEIKRYKHEILIGQTNREESVSLYNEFNSSDEAMDYIIRTNGDHIVIAVSDESASDIADLFVRMFLSVNDDKIEILNNFDISQKHNFPLRDLKICDIGIEKFNIVYPDYYNAMQKNEIILISDLMYRATGYKINIADNSDENKNPNTIYIGTAGNNNISDITGLTYKVKTENGNLYIGGNNFWADIKALYEWFIYGNLGYLQNGTFNCAVGVIGQTDLTVYEKENPVTIEAWCTSGKPVNTEQMIKDIADANFTCANLAVPANKSDLFNLLKWCAIYDLDILWFDSNVYGKFEKADFDKMAEYITAPHSLGFYLKDEPNSVDFDILASSSSAFSEVSDKLAFINLFPMYATNEQLGNNSYKEHIEMYLETVNPALCSVDIYPCNSYGLYDGYMKNLDIVATACRKKNTPLAVYIQSVSFAESKRTPTEQDIEWQSYCCLSFGASVIKYFTYITPISSAEDFKAALIDEELNKTDRWYYAQKVNSEIKYISSSLKDYKNIGAFSINCGNETKYLEFENQYDFSSVIKDIKCDNPLLFGCFEKNGEYAFTIVNMTNLQSSKGISEVKVKTDKPLNVLNKNETKLINPDSEGYVTIKLDVGDGVFCEIEND